MHISNYSKNVTHNCNYKRNLSGEKRKIIGKELQNTEGYIWQKEQINKTIDFGDKIPPHIYSTEVLRKTKQNFEERNLGIHLKDPLMSLISLIELKHTMPYAGSIHFISADPFIVHYWSPNQSLVYNDASKSKINNCRLCIDATGQLVKKIKRTSQHFKSAHIFLYSAVLHNGLSQTPVCQMVSEAQDMPSILYWLNQWIRNGAALPHEIVCDYSYALIGAITLSFCQMSRSQYSEACLKLLQKTETIIPTVHIRLDVAHFIKMVCRWTCLSKGRIREFFIRAITVLVESKTLEEFEDIFVMILVISLSETDGLRCFTEIPTPAEEFRCRIINIIKDKTIPYDSDSMTDASKQNFDEDINRDIFHLNHNSDIDNYLEYLMKKINSYCLIEGDRVNAYYVPKLKNNLMRVAKDFPMWSNVMNNHFKPHFTTATSAPVESYIGKLKRSFS